MVDVLGTLHEGEPGSKQLSSPPLWGLAARAAELQLCAQAR